MNIIAKTFAAATVAFAGFAATAPAQADYLANAPTFYPPATRASTMRDPGEWRASTASQPVRNARDDIKGRYQGNSQSSDGNGYIFN